jgi:IPT/TIG domain
MVINKAKLLSLLLLMVLIISCDKTEPNDGWNSNNQNNINNLPDGGIDSSFRVTEVDPNHGPSTGGTEVTIRGFGFDEESRIYFGGRWADPAQTIYIAPNRMMCTVPAGVVGRVPVSVMRGNGETAALAFAYTYDKFSIDPASGSMSGGTFVRITSPLNEFEEGDRFFLGEAELLDVQIVSSGLVVAKTAPFPPGEVDLNVQKSDGETVSVASAFNYYDTTDPAYGGMGGGPIEGSVTVTVLNTYGHTPEEGVFVLLGADLNSPYKGVTDSNGQITFSSPDLTGRQMVTAAVEEFEIVSFIGFNSSEITLFLTPYDPPPTPTGGIPGVPNRVYAHISGSLILRDAEFQYSCDMERMVPGPISPGYHRVVHIYQTLSSYSTFAPEVYTITEASACIEGFGYPFALTLWPGAFAIYALAGIESDDGSTFQPTSYGIVRNLVIGPGETVDAQIKVETTLTNSVSVDLINPPLLDNEKGPYEYKIKLILNLGADGYILREDSIMTTTATGVVTFNNQMDRVGLLSDSSFSIYSEAHSAGSYPFSNIFISETEGGSIETPVQLNSFLNVPTPISPVDETPINGRFSFESSPIVKPTFTRVTMNGFPSGNPYWTLYLHGELSSFILPDLDLQPGVPHKPVGDLYWHVQSSSVFFLDFDSFTYRYLSKKYWNANAADGAKFRF